MTQCEKVLEAFKVSRQMTTAQIHKIPFVANPTARISDLRAKGHVFEVTPIRGTDSSTYTYKGQHAFMEHVVSTSWRWIGGGLEVQELGGRL